MAETVTKVLTLLANLHGYTNKSRKKSYVQVWDSLTFNLLVLQVWGSPTVKFQVEAHHILGVMLKLYVGASLTHIQNYRYEAHSHLS